MIERTIKERRYLRLQAHLKQRFSREELLQLAIYEDTFERVLVFDYKGLYLIELSEVETIEFKHYPLGCLKPLILEQQNQIFYLTIETLRGQYFKIPFADQTDTYQVAEEINALWNNA